MQDFNEFFNKKLKERLDNDQLRELDDYNHLADYSSNDFLGIANEYNSGATGSRLISGNYLELIDLEDDFARHVGSENSLYYGAGYLANIGLVSSVADRFTTIFYDSLIHASLRDGIRLSLAKSSAFKHNDLRHLESLLKKVEGKKLIIVESVYSMDGDSPDLSKLFELASRYNAAVLIDEAHGLGLSGKNNLGKAQQYISHSQCMAVIYPLGKAAGLSGAFVACSNLLKSFQVNFSRSFIYTTGPSRILISQLKKQLNQLYCHDVSKVFLLKRIFLEQIDPEIPLLTGDAGAIVSLVLGSNTRQIEEDLLENGFFVKAILAPTVVAGKERLRICFHDFNTLDEVNQLAIIINRSF